MKTTEQDNCPIEVTVTGEYLREDSNPTAGRYVFAYHVSIANKGETPAQLVSRHWIITDGNESEQVVRGEGVIGKQPTIKPGETYHYSSGTVMKTPIGYMQGSYQMIAADGAQFDAPIPAFTLANPTQLN